MLKRKLLHIFIFLFLFVSLTGCSNKSSIDSKTKKETTEVIQVGENNNLLDGYRLINSINNYSFEVRNKDIEGKISYNKFDFSSCQDSLIYYGNSNLEKLHVQNIDEIQLYKTDNSFLLYNPNNAFYYFNEGYIFNDSIFSFSDEKKSIESISNLLQNLGLSNIIIDSKSIAFENNGDNYVFKAILTFNDFNKIEYNANIYIWEDSNSQKVFLIGGTDNMSDEEKNHICNSLKYNNNFISGIYDYSEKEIIFDYSGFLFNCTANTSLCFNEDIRNENNYSDLGNEKDYISLNTVNIYYPFTSKLSVYKLEVPASNKDIIETLMYNSLCTYNYVNPTYKNAEHINYYEITDSTNNLWSVYIYKAQDLKNAKFLGIYDYSSVYVNVRDNNCFVLQTWSTNKYFEFYKTKTDEMINSLMISSGNTEIPEPVSSMTSAYYMYYNYSESINTDEAVSTSTDASISTSTDAVLDLNY